MATFAAVAGCSSPPQVITGRIDPSFPTPIASVKVTTSSIQSWHGNGLITDVPVAADGSFELSIPPFDGVHIQLLAANGQSSLVFPRSLGGVQRGFTIRPNGSAFDLGLVRYVGDALTTTYTFKPAAGSDVQCNDDGQDANGAMCVDDQDNNQDQCGQNDEQEGDHEDGQANDGDNEDNVNQDDGPNVGDSIAEHNFPSDGCNDGNDGNDDGEHDDGEQNDD